MKLRKSIVTSVLFVILAGCVGLAVQESNAQRSRSPLEKHFAKHYQGEGDGLLAIDDNNTIWALYQIAGRADPTYRVLAITFDDTERPSAWPAAGRSLPIRGKIIVNAQPDDESLEISMPGTRVSFVAALAHRRPSTRTPVLNATSFGAVTLQQSGLDDLLQETADLNADVVGDAWPLVVYATHTFDGGLGPQGADRAKPPCCEENVVCLSGGQGAITCDLGLGGVSVGITCDVGFYACCCNIGGVGQIDLRANCCEP